MNFVPLLCYFVPYTPNFVPCSLWQILTLCHVSLLHSCGPQYSRGIFKYLKHCEFCATFALFCAVYAEFCATPLMLLTYAMRPTRMQQCTHGIMSESATKSMAQNSAYTAQNSTKVAQNSGVVLPLKAVGGRLN